jgi:antirestriction protein ArdC
LVFLPVTLFEEKTEYYSTLFHEIVHSTGHKKRIGRHEKIRGKFDNHNHAYSYEELVAEIGSGFLCAHADIENYTIRNTGAYIRGWIRCFKKYRRMFFFAASQAQSAVNFVLKIK